MSNRRNFLGTIAAAAAPAWPAESPLSTLTGPASAEFESPSDPSAGFTVRLTLTANPFHGEHMILEILGILQVCLREHDPDDRGRQNYPAFRMADRTVPVLEATLALSSAEHPEWNSMTIGFPLAMLRSPWTVHEVLLVFSGVRWSLYVDGHLADNDFPFGYPQWPRRTSWRLDPAYVNTASIRSPAQAATPPIIRSIQYWTPPGHNAWVGDVVTAFHRGRYHVFYLFDRRHHQSKFGKGAHYFEPQEAYVYGFSVFFNINITRLSLDDVMALTSLTTWSSTG